jgi:signal transduction histidine kinase
MKLKKRWPVKRVAAYAGVISIALAIATVASWTSFASRIDNYAYDFLFNIFPADWAPHSAVVGIDEATFREMGGPRNMRAIVADALELVARANPGAVGVDVILADRGDEIEDAKLERAMRSIGSLALSCDLAPGGWEDPLPRFRSTGAALGHIHAELPFDGVSRLIPLEERAGQERRWALSLEVFRLGPGGGAPVIESPDDLEVGSARIPAPRGDGERPMRIRFLRSGIPTISVAALKRDPSLGSRLKDKAVFIGVTALTAARDRYTNPYQEPVPGVAIHAHAYETIAARNFLTTASNSGVLAACVLLSLAAGLIFALRSGWLAYALAALLLIAAHSVPAIFFRMGVVFPYSAVVSAAWLSVVSAAGFQYFATRRQLKESESDKARYQQAIHFVTHEMRTPLTAIQGSSELMGRYNLGEDKRKQMVQMINTESKRLAKMIQTFLDVERLSEGQMELKRLPFGAREVIEACVERVRPLAERKQIRVFTDELNGSSVMGDRELMEYAIYNLLTNAIKYSPGDTEVHVESTRDGDHLRVSVRDQGIGMDARELKNIFRKFYRTKKAEASGEAGTGIGLSIVEQIVLHHGGRMEVASTPGKGSTFTIIVPAGVPAPAG